MIGRVRGKGTFIAMSLNNTQLRDAVVYRLRQSGIESGGCGAFSIRLRPSMVFMPEHAAQFLETFEQVLADCVDLGLGEASEWNTEDPRNMVDPVTGMQGAFHPIVPSNTDLLMADLPDDGIVHEGYVGFGNDLDDDDQGVKLGK